MGCGGFWFFIKSTKGFSGFQIRIQNDACTHCYELFEFVCKNSDY